MRSFERLEKRNLFSIFTIGDSNHDAVTDNLDYQSALCHLATALGNRPIANTSYEQTTQPLFKDGPTYSDVVQGSINDCAILSALSEVALQNPNIIQDMFLNNYDGTYTFKYYIDPQPYIEQGIANYIIIDTQLPSGYASYTNELWVALAEKGFAQINGGNYELLNGFTLGMLNQITGKTYMFPFTNINEVTTAFSNGSFIGFETGIIPDNSTIIPNHSYALYSYDNINQTMTLYNPWGYLQTFSYADIENTNNFHAIVGVNP